MRELGVYSKTAKKYISKYIKINMQSMEIYLQLEVQYKQGIIKVTYFDRGN